MIFIKYLIYEYQDVIYALEEGTIEGTIHDRDTYGGKTLFGKEIEEYADKTAFSSGVMLFNNSDKIKMLFNKIKEDMINRPYIFLCPDQGYIVYNAFKYRMYDNKTLKLFVVNNDDNIHSNKVIHHFPGGGGIFQHKKQKMMLFLHNLNNYVNFSHFLIFEKR